MDLAANEIYDILRKHLFRSLPAKAEIGDIASVYGKKLEEASRSKVAGRGAEAIADETMFKPNRKSGYEQVLPLPKISEVADHVRKGRVLLIVSSDSKIPPEEVQRFFVP